MHIGAIGEEIKHRREAKNMTQQQLATLLGITPAAVSQWETKGTVPRAKTLAKIEQALGVLLEDSFSESSVSWSIEDDPVSVQAHIEKLKAKVAAAIGVEAGRVFVNITIADCAPSQSVAA